MTRKTGDYLWSDSKRWGNLYTDFQSAIKILIDELDKRINEEQSSGHSKKWPINAVSEMKMTWNHRTFVVLVSLFLLIGAVAFGQKKNSVATSRTARSQPAPTLGFNHTKDLPPVFDMDAYAEELKLKKDLPNNAFVDDKRAMHEGALMNDFVEAFKDAKECNGITLYMQTEKKPAFTVQIAIDGHDEHPDDQTWTWMLAWPGDPSPPEKSAHGMGGMGSQSSAKLTARDVCLTIWDDVDPNHFKKPGGKVE